VPVDHCELLCNNCGHKDSGNKFPTTHCIVFCPECSSKNVTLFGISRCHFCHKDEKVSGANLCKKCLDNLYKKTGYQ